nr:uncharacterized protein LOC112211380 [Halyomorpha halys]
MLFSVIFVSLLFSFSEASFSKHSHNIVTNDFGHDSMYDLIMDVILEELKFYLKTHHDTVIVIPPLSTGFEYDVIGIPLTGQFNATDGEFTNPATIKRQGDVNVTHSPQLNKISISMTVTFSQMQVTFKNYTASIIGIYETGSINVTVTNNSLFMEITLTFVPQCIVSISKLEIRQMSGILVDITGLGFLNGLQSEIISWVLESYRTSFTEIIENIIQEKLQEELAKTKICKLKRRRRPLY